MPGHLARNKGVGLICPWQNQNIGGATRDRCGRPVRTGAPAADLVTVSHIVECLATITIRETDADSQLKHAPHSESSGNLYALEAS
jgi:hypothetical protein